MTGDGYRVAIMSIHGNGEVYIINEEQRGVEDAMESENWNFIRKNCRKVCDFETSYNTG